MEQHPEENPPDGSPNSVKAALGAVKNILPSDVLYMFASTPMHNNEADRTSATPQIQVIARCEWREIFGDE